ncbi:MAG TPA: hypothetical protein VID67_09895 [Rhizomicrobium sp.]|jgi:hypothetical protein
MAPGPKRNGKIDEQIEESFPASDPPSFMGGEVLGAPPRRKSTNIKRGKPAKKKTKAAARKDRPAKKPAAKKKVKTKKRATKKRKSR